MKIAVVILNWNGKRLLEEFLPSVIKFSTAAQVYVADNASTDDSVEFVQSHFPSVKIIQNSENSGYAGGYNQALREVEEELYILLNSDVEVSENWLEAIRLHFQSHPETAIAQPKILDYKNKAYFEYAGAAGGYIDKYAYPFCRGRIFSTLEKDEGQYEEETPIFWASGACLILRREIFWELGGLDELFFAHQEEIDLCWRAFNRGYTVFYLPGSVVFHLGGATLNEMNPYKTYLNFRNSLFLLLKNVSGFRVYVLLFIRLCLDGLAGIKFLFEAKPLHTWAIIRAHFGFYKRFYAIYKKRKSIRSVKPIKTSANYFKVKSIAWAYYVRGKKKYPEL